MNKNNFLELGKELVIELRKTWGNLFFLRVNWVNDKTLEELGRALYFNEEIFNDFKYYKYELQDEYNCMNKPLEHPWIAEWMYDERGDEFQRPTFDLLMQNYVIPILTSYSGGWYYDKDHDFYMPIGCFYNPNTSRVYGSFTKNNRKMVITKESYNR